MTTGKKYSNEQLSEALRAITSLIGKLVKVQRKLRKGSPQHTLAKNRLKALRVASTLIKMEAGASHSRRNPS